MDTIARGTVALVKLLKFWWYCLAYAWRGSFTLANAWQGLWGTVLLWAFGYWRKIPVTIPDKVDNYALLFLLASLGATWLGVFIFQFLKAPAALYWVERDKSDALARAGKSEFFSLNKNIYSESKRISWGDGTQSEFWETRFYVIVGNALETGHTLRRVQARIFHIGEPVITQVKDTGNAMTDIRHGEWAFFEIGKIVSSERYGSAYSGPIILDDEAKRQYESNVPHGYLSFEVVSQSGKRKYGLAHSPEQVWRIFVVISADDALAMQIRISIDMANKDSNPVSCEVVA